MAAINVTKDTHGQIRHLSRQLLAAGVETNIGDVGDHLWEFVRTKHADEFEAFVRERVSWRR